MKKLSLICVLVFFACIAFGQTDCRPYMPTAEGTVWEMTNYNAKGKEAGKMVYELVEKEVSGTEITFKVNMLSYDKKEKEGFSSSYEAKCVDGKFELDMAFKMDGNMMEAFQNMETEVDASDYELPDLDATPGTQLQDASLRVAVDGGGPLTMNLKVDITNRKIEAKEKLNTAAGSFDCVVVSQDVSTKLMMGTKGSSKEWYAPEVGLVRAEYYNKNGKLMDYSELTKLEQK